MGVKFQAVKGSSGRFPASSIDTPSERKNAPPSLIWGTVPQMYTPEAGSTNFKDTVTETTTPSP